MNQVRILAAKFTWEEAFKQFAAPKETLEEFKSTAANFIDAYKEANGRGDFTQTVQYYPNEELEASSEEFISDWKETFKDGEVRDEGTDFVSVIADSMEKSLWIFGYIYNTFEPSAV